MNRSNAEDLAARRAAILAAVPFAVVVMDGDGHVIEANAAAHRLLGIDGSPRGLKKLVGRVVHPVTGAPIPEADLPWQRALAGESGRDRNVAIISGSGGDQRRLITISAQPFRDPRSQTSGALIIAFDRVQLLLRQSPLGDLLQ